MLKTLLALVSVTVCAWGSAFAQGTPADVLPVDWFNSSTRLLLDNAGNPLPQGSAAGNSDGALVQLGYYDAATTANNFAGNWVPLTGALTANRTSIGDSPDNTGLGAGRIGFSTVFRFGSNLVQVYDAGIGDTGAYVTNSSITITTGSAVVPAASQTPRAGQILAIRFYNTADGASGFYNAVSTDLLGWQWIVPTATSSGLVLDLANTPLASLEFEDFNNQFRTTIAIPEPTSVTLCALGAVTLAWAARRARRG